MERSDLMKSVSSFFGRSPGKDGITCHHEIKQDEFFYYALIPVAFSVTVLAFLKRRRWKRLDLWGGRPGVPWPINFLEDQDNRLAYVAAFGLTSWNAWDALTGDIPFKWSTGNRFVTNFARISACLMSALICYPIFGSIASDHIIGLALGSLYIWMYAVVYVVSNYPCVGEGEIPFLIELLQIVPALVCMVYLCFLLPWRCWKQGLKQWKFAVKHRSENSMWADNVKTSTSYQYVKELLAANRSEGIAERKRILQKASSKVYRNIPGFKYSLSILVGVLVSVQFVYVGTLDVMKFYRSLLYHLRKPLSPRLPNETRFPTYVRLAYEMISTSTEGQKEANEFKEQYVAWVDAFEVSCYISAALAFISTATAVLLTLRNYRRHILLLYRGQRLPIVPSAERDARPTNIVTNGAKYVGFQFGYSIWGFVYQAALLLVVCFSLSALYLSIARYHKFQSIIDWIWNVLGPITIYVVGLLIVQRVLVRFWFLQRDERGRLVLAFNNRRLLWNFQYFMVFANSTLGLVSCFIRIFKALLFGAWTLPRLDVSMLNRHFERFDNGYAAYAGLLAIESCHTNPVLVTFTKLLWLTQCRNRLDFQNSDGQLCEIAQIDQRRRLQSSRTKTLRNRWQLYVTLYHNPGLRLLRKEVIRIDRLMHAEDVILDDALIEAPRLRLLFRRVSDRKDLVL